MSTPPETAAPPKAGRKAPISLEIRAKARAMFVDGETVTNTASGAAAVTYPGMKRVAKVFGLSPSTVHKWMVDENWPELREKKRGLRVAVAKEAQGTQGGASRAAGVTEALETVQNLVAKVGKRLTSEAATKRMGFKEFEGATKLEAWLKREQMQLMDPAAGVITLQMLQERHAHRRRELYPEMSGEIGDESLETGEASQAAQADQV